jgi:hypothetical protein
MVLSIGFVVSGQRAAVKVDAFPLTLYRRREMVDVAGPACRNRRRWLIVRQDWAMG